MKKNTGVRLLYVMFFLSGAAGLVYQVVWARLFGLIFGNTIFASSTVLAAFMAGLAIGSFFFGKYITKHKLKQNGLKLYFIMELLVGTFGVAMPWVVDLLGGLYTGLFRSAEPSFAVLTAFRFVMSFLVLVIPCVFMGATLPVLSATIVEKAPEKKGVIGRLYGINTLGAVAGCLFSGFLFVGRLGITNTSILAAALNVSVALLSLLLFLRFRNEKAAVAAPAQPVVKGKNKRKQPEPAKPVIPADTPEPRHVGTVLLVCYLLSGFAAMALEVAWTKAMVWIMAMDSYAFAAMLSIILAGIGLGSLLHTLLARWIKHEKPLLVVIQFAIGITVLLSITVIQNSVALKAWLENAMNNVGAMSAIYQVVSPATISQLVLSAFVLLLPSVLMGFAFPVITGLYVRIRGEVGSGVGNIYSANTLGSIAGSLLMGFVLMPAIGLLPAIAAMAGIYLAISVVLLVAFTPAWTRVRLIKAGAFAAVALLFVFTTNYRSVDFIATTLKTHNGGDAEKLLYFQENATGDVLVKESKKYGHEMIIDGVQVASDGDFDLHSHLYPAHLMSLLHKNPEDILVVAFGCGGTGGSILKYDDVRQMDVVEICDGVVEPAKQFFTPMNSNVFENPKLNLIIQDGKNYVRMTDKSYDIIYSGPIHPQSNQGSAALYTKEYFEDCRARLKPGGFQCLWLPMHMSSAEDFKIIVKTYLEVYPYVSMWILPQTDTSVAHPHLIGSMEPIDPDYQLIVDKMAKPGIREDLQRLNDTAFSEPYEFIAQFAMGTEALHKFVQGIDTLNTDDLPIVEYYDRPADYVAATAASKSKLLADLGKYMENPWHYVQNVPGDERDALKAQLDRLYEANRYLVQGHFYLTAANIISLDVESQIRDNYQKAYELLPESEYLRKFFEQVAGK